LNWNAATNATGYNVNSSTTNSGSYALIGTNLNSLAFTNTGLTNGVLYYFVISATNVGGESANSPSVSARPVSTSPTPLNFTVGVGQLQLNWAPDHTGWMLQAQTNPLVSGLANNWVTLSNTASTNQMLFPMGSTNGSVFFRLIYQ
jgi:hypothetical protein